MVSLLSEPARPGAVRRHPLAPWFAVATVCFGAFMGQLDASIVTLAFPALQRQFGTGLAAVQWVSLGYLVALVALLVPVGRVSDRAGRKLIYMYGFAVFTLASAACGFAWSLPVLVGLRVLQAVGAAMLQANSVALVATSVAAHRRRAALGVQAAAQSLGLAAGPTIGGVLVASIGWRWVFLINVPVGIVALIAGWFLLPRTRNRERGGATDPAGTALLAAAAIAGLLAVSAVSGLALPSWAVAALAVTAVAAVIGLLRWERRARAPLLDPAAMSSLAAGLAGALCAYLVLFGPLVLFPQVLAAHGDSSARAGIILTALPVGFGVAAVAAERLLPAYWSDRRRCTLGGLLAAAATAALAAPAPTAARMLFLGLLGVGLGVYIPANNAAIMAKVPADQAARAGGLINMTRGLGTAIGVTLVAFTLHLTDLAHRPGLGAPLTAAVLALGALLAVVAGHTTDASAHRPGGSDVDIAETECADDTA